MLVCPFLSDADHTYFTKKWCIINLITQSKIWKIIVFQPFSIKTLLLYTYIIFSTIDLVSPSRSDNLEFSGWTLLVLISGSVVTNFDHHSILFIFSRLIMMFLKTISIIYVMIFTSLQAKYVGLAILILQKLDFVNGECKSIWTYFLVIINYPTMI